MLDTKAQDLDAKILAFIKKFGTESSPDEAFNQLALEIFHYQFKHNKNYRKWCLGQEGDAFLIPKHWKNIPAMPTLGFKEFDLLTFDKKKAQRVFETSGTTEAKSGRHYFETLELYKATIPGPFKKYFLEDSQDFSYFFLLSSPQEAPSSSLSYMMGFVNHYFSKSQGKFYMKQSRMDFKALAADLMGEKKKVAILATAFSLKSFLDFLKENKMHIHLKPKSRLMETGGFKGRVQEISKAMLYKQCAAWLGLDKHFCISEYGMTELSSQFYDTTLLDHLNRVKTAPCKIGPSWTRTLVIDPQSGAVVKKNGVGLLRHFDLANRASVMAIQTEDLGRAKGNGFELLGRAEASDVRGCSLSYEGLLNQ